MPRAAPVTGDGASDGDLRTVRIPQNNFQYVFTQILYYSNRYQIRKKKRKK